MQKQELKNTFIDTLERERTIRGWTQWEMAEKLEMSVPGYRKMVSGNDRLYCVVYGIQSIGRT